MKQAGKIPTKEEIVQLFQTHERQWTRIKSSTDSLTWDSFPWPMLKRPNSVEELTTLAISGYILSPLYPGDKTKSSKDRIKEHIRRWHPDRFDTQMLPRVVEAQKEKVKEGAGLVARGLSELLTRSNVHDVFS
ncbi:hypothetical protein PLICRDRAFT_117606 [Plicaturopsis crispa FD-325 SS-3]|uniref:Uncharacterized protein n=1 Tax=Plicaturopsis crispa FD-325 SS-3 TaxID=944288 RepID=A0A0C9SRG5_PLICR|nr:hypothetical protein PLICRDRAFT_117606 [Plicaturopsis crispa FD-325 SS-3]